jgi:OmpA-OmpF porin, OOP family
MNRGSALLTLAAGALATGLLATATPGFAEVVQVEDVCNPVLTSARDAVHGSRGDMVTHGGTYDCPPPPAPVVAAVPQPEPAAPPPPPLPQGGTVYFDLDSAAIAPEAERVLTAMVAEIQGRELTGITVTGHTDRSGSPAYNEALSQRRAEAVAVWLEDQGVPAQVVNARGVGEADLAVPTEDGVVMQANRRVVVDFAR